MVLTVFYSRPFDYRGIESRDTQLFKKQGKVHFIGDRDIDLFGICNRPKQVYFIRFQIYMSGENKTKGIGYSNEPTQSKVQEKERRT